MIYNVDSVLYSVVNKTGNRKWILDRSKLHFLFDYIRCWMNTFAIFSKFHGILHSSEVHATYGVSK